MLLGICQNDVTIVRIDLQVETIERIFKDHRDDPPRHHYQSPVAGAINWERHLFYCIKRPILRFLNMEEMMQSERGKAVRAKYLSVGKQMKAYEDDLYEKWRERTEEILPGLLKRFLLCKANDREASSLTGMDQSESESGNFVQLLVHDWQNCSRLTQILIL